MSTPRPGGRRPLALIKVVCAVAAALVLQAAVAQPLGDFGEKNGASSYFNNAPSARVTLREATAIAREHTGGRVLSANPRQRAGRVEYRVRMLVDGQRVITVVVDQKGNVSHKR